MKNKISIIISLSIILLNALIAFASEPNVFFYPADIEEGIIGGDVQNPSDNPTDNVFVVVLDKKPKATDQILLSYDLFGVNDHTGIIRSINNQLAVGGYLVEKNTNWTKQVEQLNPKWLKEGKNIVRFTLPKKATHQYKIKNLGIEIKNAIKSKRSIVINQPKHKKSANNWAYVKGFLKGKGSEKAKLYINNVPQRILSNEFQALKYNNQGTENWTVSLKAIFEDGEVIKENVNFTNHTSPDLLNEIPLAAVAYTSNEYQPAASFVACVEETEIIIEPGALEEPTEISITALREVDIPPLDIGMINVTKNREAYRFLPHGINFNKAAKIKLAYDENKIPEGYSAKDIKTYFFDETTKHWVPLPFDTLLVAENILQSKTTHFTDMINGIIKAPESPETGAFTPTSIKDIKAADPSANIVTIEPPSASNMGTANLNVPIKLPPGRLGMQPSIAIQYNSEGGNGWCGLGWNVNTPSITVDTRWGVPRFNEDKETETYNLNGQMLSPVAHRDELINREDNKIFHLRVEGAFQKIIRHGKKTDEYWWEVVDKNGTRNFYGGTLEEGLIADAVLGNEDGISNWCLVETRDLNGNFVRYNYKRVNNTGIADGKEVGTQLYCEEINYTGHIGQNGQKAAGKYKIIFETEQGRPDVQINCRLGFKQVTADLLSKISVYYNEEHIRSYELNYKEGPFFKTLLETVVELDANQAEFYRHEFDYFEDVLEGNTYVPYNQNEILDPLFSVFDGIAFLKDDELSAIGMNKSSTFSGGFGISYGPPIPKANAKLLTLGANYSRSRTNSFGLVSFTDIDADGLPDIVYKPGTGDSKIRFIKNTSNIDELKFDPETKKIIGMDDFSKSITKSNTLGFEANPPIAFVGFNKPWSKTTTDKYISDFNGDGLIDWVSGGMVYFNYIENGLPNFKINSGISESPLFAGAQIIDVVEEDDSPIPNPLHDVIRVWYAPKPGLVKVSDKISLNIPNTEEAKEYTGKDGVKYSIEHDSIVRETRSITADQNGVSFTVETNEFQVTQNEAIYFRLSSITDGAYDEINSNPIIEYQNLTDTFPDTYGKNPNTYIANDDFMLSAEAETFLPYDGTIKITGKVTKPKTSGKVKLEAIIDGDKKEVELETRAYENEEVAFDDIVVNESAIIECKVTAITNQDWSKIKWTPKVEYLNYSFSFTENPGPVSLDSLMTDVNKVKVIDVAINEEDIDSTNEIILFPMVEYKMFNNILHAAQPYQLTSGMHNISFIENSNLFSSLFNGTITIAARNQAMEVLGYKSFEIINGDILGESAFNFETTNDEPVLFELYAENNALAALIAVEINNIIINSNSFKASVLTSLTDEQKIFGTRFRGWGQFVYNSNDGRDALPINQSLLKINDNIMDAEAPTDKMEIDSTYNPIEDIFITMCPDYKNNRWMGYDDLTYIGADFMSSSRMGEDAISQTTAFQLISGNQLNAPKKKSKTTGRGWAFGGAPLFYNHSYTTSKANTEVITEVMDINGDRYPDIVRSSAFQYTNARGGLEEAEVENKIGIHKSSGKASGYSLGGTIISSSTPTTGITEVANMFKKPKAGNENKSTEKASISVGFNGNAGLTKDKTGESWLDINGDGLPDKVKLGENNDLLVQLNVGNGFLKEEKWQTEADLLAIRRGATTDVAGGLSFGAGINGGGCNGANKWNASFTFGTSGSTSTNHTLEALNDVNSDGLPDFLRSECGFVEDSLECITYVSFNTGTGFKKEQVWEGLHYLDQGTSSGSSGNANISGCINFPWGKLCGNITGSIGDSWSATHTQLTDFNGDGYPDYLASYNDKLQVKTSTIRRTNLLKSVTRPLGSKFNIDYELVGNTYDLPNGKWVLSEVTIYDGFAGDGADYMANTFDYQNGYHDRHEREFYGFETVTTHQHYTNGAERDKVYRTNVATYNNRNYYEKGLLANQKLMDEEGNPYTETVNLYQLKNVDNVNTLLSTSNFLRGNEETVLAAQLKQQVYGYKAFPALTKTIKKFYEGEAEPQKGTAITYLYDEFGNIKTFIDIGDDSAADTYIANISYHKVEDKYIMNAPKSITVTGGNGIEYRKREADINTNTGNVTEMRMFLADGESTNYNMSYDTYGNIIELQRPWNYKGERLSYQYEYDPEVHTYNTKVTDAYDYESAATYDYRFGQMLSSTDLNQNEMRYEIDEVGRITTITGPFELAAGLPYTIAFEYYPMDTAGSYALTKHYDPQHPGNDIETYTFIDGLKRPLQIKKDGAFYSGHWKPDEEKMIVSGRLKFDAFGRTVESYYPVTEAQGTQSQFQLEYDEITPSKTTYDVLDRPITQTLPDEAKTEYEYGFGDDLKGDVMFKTTIKDAEGSVKESYTNLRELKVATREQYEEGKFIWTSFNYNPVNELVAVIDDHENIVTYAYDMLGRKSERQHPDAGRSYYQYDLASNLLKKQTANLLNQFEFIEYEYFFERLTNINYPFNTYNNVSYTYGDAGAEDNRAGRIVKQSDATGEQEFWYDMLGAINQNTRTIHVPDCETLTFTTKWTYDTWNRLIEMEYPDTEVVTYNYNVGGKLYSMFGLKKETDYPYIKQVSYDEFEQRTYLHYGNNTTTHYAYDSLRRRLDNMTVETPDHRKFIDYKYTYDDVSNITQFANRAGVEKESYLLGGQTNYEYKYDDMYRLVEATGSHTGSKGDDQYVLNMTYNNVHSIVNKDQTHLRKINTASVFVERNKTTYNNDYKYDDKKQPHAPIKVGNKNYSYDANGNQTGWDSNKDEKGFRRALWDEENRLAAINDNGAVFKYLYDADGERVIKNTGISQAVSINGEEHPLYDPETWAQHWNNGEAWLNHWHDNHHSSGNHQHEHDDHEHHHHGTSGHDHLGDNCLGNSTIYVNPYVVVRNREVTKHFYIEGQRIVTKMADPYDELLQDNRGPLDDLHDEEHGFAPNVETNVYFYHPDHLGSTGYVTQIFGEVNQHVEYFAFGETFYEEQNNTTDQTPYLFNAKELDEETGLYYYGARYYDPVVSNWLSVDPLADKYKGWSSYHYALLNPLKFIDSDGMQSTDTSPPNEIIKKDFQKEYERSLISNGLRFEQSPGYLGNSVYKDESTFVDIMKHVEGNFPLNLVYELGNDINLIFQNIIGVDNLKNLDGTKHWNPDLSEEGLNLAMTAIPVSKLNFKKFNASKFSQLVSGFKFNGKYLNAQHKLRGKMNRTLNFGIGLINRFGSKRLMQGTTAAAKDLEVMNETSEPRFPSSMR